MREEPASSYEFLRFSGNLSNFSEELVITTALEILKILSDHAQKIWVNSKRILCDGLYIHYYYCASLELL